MTDTDTDDAPRIDQMPDFALRVRQLLDKHPRICEGGCNTMSRNPDMDDMTQIWVRKTRMFNLDDREIERLRKMCAFIGQNLPHDTWRGGRKLIGSYGFKHVLEKQNWTEDTNRYVSNGEGIVAMMLCGYKPRWSKDNTNPNCLFSVRGGKYRELVELAEQR